MLTAITHKHLLLVLSLLLLCVPLRVIAQDAEATEAVIIPLPTEEAAIADEVPPLHDDSAATADWMVVFSFIGGAINSFAGGATFMAGLFWLIGRFSHDRQLIAVLEKNVDALKDSWPAGTQELLMKFGTALQQVGQILVEVVDDVPLADKEIAQSTS